MAWTTLDLNNLLAGEPLIESEVLALYENPIAIAEGAPGAPRNHGKSLAESILADTSLAAVADSITFTDIPEYTRYGVYFDNVRAAVSDVLNFRVFLSSDNGATFSDPLAITAAEEWNVDGLFGKVEISKAFGCTTLLNLSNKKDASSFGGLTNRILDFTDQINGIRIEALNADIAIGSRVILTGILDRIEAP